MRYYKVLKKSTTAQNLELFSIVLRKNGMRTDWNFGDFFLHVLELSLKSRERVSPFLIMRVTILLFVRKANES